jgi:hypothetical protein
MPGLRILRHHRAPSSPDDGTHRWRVELADEHALDVELSPEERASLDLSDDELHDLLPTALSRRHGEGDPTVNWGSVVNLYADHFRG